MRFWGNFFYVLAVGSFLLICNGCGSSTENLWDQITQLGQERNTLETEVEQLRSENKTLSGQVETLSSLRPDVRLDALSTLSKIEFGKRTGFFDKDKDDKVEKLIVYLQTIDDSEDVVKAVGAVEVELWNLNAEASGAFVHKWLVEPTELKKLWAKTFMSSYYRLDFDVSDMLTDDMGELTVKVRFTEYLTGKVFKKQSVVSIDD